MEPDFVTRNHIDSVPMGDAETRRLLNTYKFPPPQPQQQHQMPQAPAGAFPVFMGGNSDAVMLGNMIGQLQGTINQQNQQRSSGFGGLNLSIDSDVLKWLLLLLVVALLIWVVFKIKSSQRRNPMLKKMKRIEKELKMLRKNPEVLALHKKAKVELPDDEPDE